MNFKYQIEYKNYNRQKQTLYKKKRIANRRIKDHLRALIVLVIVIQIGKMVKKVFKLWRFKMILKTP